MGKVLRFCKLKSWEDYFEEFLLQKELEGLRPRTLNDYRYYSHLSLMEKKDCRRKREKGSGILLYHCTYCTTIAH